MVKIRDRVKPAYAEPVEETAYSKGILAAYGVATGWLALRLLNLSRKVVFSLDKPVEGIKNYCLDIGYPKQQDYFWYFGVLLTALGGAALAIGGRWLLRKAGWKGMWSWWPSLAGIACLTSGTLLALPWQPETPASGVLFCIMGAILPWFDTRWVAVREEPVPEEPDFRPTLPDSVKWAVLALLLAILAGFDPCKDWRNIDGYHEGNHLAYFQSWLVGDKPGTTVWPEYDPLYIYSFAAWMKTLGLTIYIERWYFQTVQILGTALHIAVLRWVCRTWIGSFMGFWTMLTMSLATYVLYGASNSLRTAIPFAGMVACWRGLESGSWKVLAGSGALFGVAMLYSKEYAGTCLMSCLIMFAAAVWRGGLRGRVREVLAWGGGAAAAMAMLIVAMFGTDTMAAVARMLGGGYASSRLSGHLAQPFPVFPHLTSFTEVWIRKWGIFENVALWWPAFIAGATGAWVIGSGKAALGGRRLLALALIVSGLIMQIPAIIRPVGNIATAGTMIPILALAALVVDWMWGRGGSSRVWGGIVAVLLFVFGMMRLYSFSQEFRSKRMCLFTGPDTHKRLVERIGMVRVSKPQEEGIAYVVKKMRQLCPPDKRIYLSAPFYNHLLFLADRAGMPPYITTTIAATSAQRAIILQSLEKYKPPLAVLTDSGIDIPFAEEHKEEWEYIQKHYRLYAVAEQAKFYVRVR